MKPNISSSPFWGSRKLTIISTFGSGFAVQQSIGGTWLHLNVLGLEVTASSSLHPWHLMLSITCLCAAADENSDFCSGSSWVQNKGECGWTCGTCAIPVRKLLLFLLLKLFSYFYVMFCILCVALWKIWMDSHLSFSNTKKAYSRKKILSYSNGKEDNRDFGSFPSSELLLISLKLVSECVLSYLYICFSVESRALDVILRILRWHSICFCRKGLKFSFFLIAALRERLNNRAGWCRVLKGCQQVWTRRSLVLH